MPAPWACSTASGMDRRFFHRLGASRLDRTICSSAGGAALTQALGTALRHRARAVPPLEADHRLGREHSRHQRPPVAVHHGGAAQRREAATRSTRIATAPARPADRHFSINPGSDMALALAMMHVIIGEGLHDARLRRAPHRGLRPSCASACGMDARSAPRAHRHRGRRHRAAGARVRHHAARGHPPELRRAAQRTRRHGGAQPSRCCPRVTGSWKEVGGGLQAFHFAGLPLQPRRAWRRADLQRSRRSAARRASSTCR